MMHDTQSCTAEVVSKREVMPGIFLVVLNAPLVAAHSRAGQFIMIQTQSGSDPFLRRPISLCGASSETVEILFQVRGRGTGIMASWEPGRSVSVLGPFGNGFVIPADLQTAVLVAGGIGAAPLLYLMKSLSAEFQHVKSIFLFGSRNQVDSALLKSASVHMLAHSCMHVTEDGSTEHAGLVTDACEASISRGDLGAGRACIYSCGPAPMLKKVALIAAAHSIPCQVSLEAHMACGVGACLGCVVEAKGGFKRVCADGPVFDSSVLGWNYD